MSIVFDEEEYAKSIISNGIQLISKKYYDLQIVANYLREQNYKDEEIEKELHRISKMSFSDYNWVKMYNAIDTRVKRSKKQKLKRNPEIIVTQSELDLILGEDDRKIRNLMFVCLVLAKYYMSNNHTDKYYMMYKDTDVFGLCDMFVRKYERLDLLYYLAEKGYITPTRYLGFTVNYVNEDSPTILKFKPDVDMVYYFEQYQGGIFVNCENCGRLTKKTNNKTKYCRQCAKIKKDELQSRRYKVYVLTNTVNGMQYVGRTSQSLKSRFNNGKGYSQSCMAGDIEKYGWDKFDQTLIKDKLTKDEACELEMKMIKELKTQELGYNISEGGMGKDSFNFSLGNRIEEISALIEDKKKKFKSNLIFYKNVGKDDKYIYYCIEKDAYFKGLKTLCKSLKVEEHAMEYHITKYQPYYGETFIKSKNEYEDDKITDEIKLDIKEQISAKIETELNNPYL